MSKVINILSFDVQDRLKNGESVTIIDVREPEEVAQVRIPGVKHIRLSELQSRQNEIDPEKETIFVCRSGNRSAMACEYLMGQGYRNVKNLMGGMSGWNGHVEKN
ncbi:rhodanese-like domain-containing protein [Tumebacillus sp. ITR2]|uniref:Rhodanese-like domain-containing protein n=1 Tax=Tumebacillus amylolyticus TaxID=2801339 RepID=A0ABS1J5P5_9BACL|nr:rhodanese-like domain-containing protein [Tumebacillus amylolyticus]